MEHKKKLRLVRKGVLIEEREVDDADIGLRSTCYDYTAYVIGETNKTSRNSRTPGFR